MLIVGFFKSITAIWNILHLFSHMDKMVQRVWLNELMQHHYKMC